MRESIGATWIFGIVLAFIALFSGYLAFSVNYSRAFRMKDGIIERIEKYNGFSTTGKDTTAIEDIDNFMSEIGYSTSGNCYKLFGSDSNAKWYGVSHGVLTSSTDAGAKNGKFNYCIQKVSASNTNGQLSSSYYKIYVFFSISLPLIDTSNMFFVSGETSNIYYPVDTLQSTNVAS